MVSLVQRPVRHFALVCALTALACGGGDGPESLRPVGSACSADGECASGRCLRDLQLCTVSCDEDLHCNEYLPSCGIGPDGEMVCVNSCGYGSYVCGEDGIPVSCEWAPETFCLECGSCPSSLRCDPGVGCVQKSLVGGPCRVDSDCHSDNCSAFAGVCRVAVGQPCTASVCDECMTSDAWSFCSRPCRATSECNGHHCLGYDPYYSCYPSCSTFSDASCPGTCIYASSGQLYCDCPDCAVLSPIREMGHGCKVDDQCATGYCYSYFCIGGDCYRDGYCSATCGSDADCTNGTRCVDVPCVGSDPYCGALCLPECGYGAYCIVGACRQLNALGSVGSIDVCDIKLPLDESCTFDYHCQSGSCVGGRCT
jgi:hypothetical protein